MFNDIQQVLLEKKFPKMLCFKQDNSQVSNLERNIR